MDSNKLGVISKMWRRCKSLNDIIGEKVGSMGRLHHSFNQNKKSLSHRITTIKSPDQNKAAPMGCFPVYVGVEKERFVIRTEHVNHPLFKNLLEQAELEYGYGNMGPLILPCQVDHFIDVVMEMECSDGGIGNYKGCSFVARSHTSFHFLNPPRVITALLG